MAGEEMSECVITFAGFACPQCKQPIASFRRAPTTDTSEVLDAKFELTCRACAWQGTAYGRENKGIISSVWNLPK